MYAFNDRTGVRYGRLVALSIIPGSRRGYRWLCRCDCGKETVVDGSHLTTGHTVSCGCLRTEQLRKRHTKHGHAGAERTATYQSWASMRARCLNPDHHDYANYGGRGITVSDTWSDFAVFLADVGTRPRGTSIDRIDNDGNYEPGNVKWSTRLEQNNNRRKRRWTKRPPEERS